MPFLTITGGLFLLFWLMLQVFSLIPKKLFFLPNYPLLTFAKAPIPEFLVRHVRCVCGGFCGDEEYEEEEVSQGIYDAAHFITGSLVASGLLLPLVLAHTQVV